MSNQPKSTIEYYSRPEMERRRMAIYYAALGTQRELFNELGQALLQPTAPTPQRAQAEVVDLTAYRATKIASENPNQIGGQALNLTTYENTDAQALRAEELLQTVHQIHDEAA